MIIVGGATATGKSAFAEYIAESIGGELVSADSMQIYRGMDIGTAKDPDPSVPLHMTDIVSPKDNFTVVDYRDRAVKVISDIAARGGEAVVVGGTGLYIDSLLYDMAYGGSGEKDESLMDSLKQELEEKGAKRVFLEVRVSNAPAMSMYLKYGFCGLYARSRYYPDGEDALVMVKELG